MIFQGKDGELRIIEYGSGATRYYMEVLFCEMNLTGAIARPRSDETLIMNRGKMDTDAHYVDGDDAPRHAPLPVSFSCRLADTVNSRILSDWLAGVTTITNAASGTTTIISWDGNTTMDSITIPAFRDSGKSSYRLEVLWSPSTSASTLGYRWEQVYFPPSEQTITESGDNLILSANGQVYGDVSRMTAFSATLNGTTYAQFV